MKSHCYDIVRKDDNSSIWLEATPNLYTAECRIRELSYLWPGEFRILDQRNHQIVDSVISSSDRVRSNG
jgi:hypothetical protein